MSDIAQNPEAMQLVTQLMAQNARDAAFTTNALLDYERQRADKAEAILACVRAKMDQLLARGFMPTSEMLSLVVYPLREEWEQYLPETENQ